MVNIVDKGKKKDYDQSDLMGMKPFGSIGPCRKTEEIVKKLKNKKTKLLRAAGSSSQSGEKANLGEVSKKLKGFVNR